MELTGVFEPAAEGGYTAFVVEVPGVNTQGDTLEEARENLADALELFLAWRRDEAQRGLSTGAVREPVGTSAT